MEYKNRTIRIENIPDSPINLSVKLKPMGSLYLMILVSGVLLVSERFWIFGVLFFAITIYALIFIPDRKLMDLTNEFVVSYFHNNKEECLLIYWDEIAEWQYILSKGSNDYMRVVLTDGDSYLMDATTGPKLTKFFRKYASGKEVISTVGKGKAR